jgi:hypothetical protein
VSNLLPAPKQQPLRGTVVDAPPGRAAGQPPVLALLDFVSFVMDRAVEIPGTKVRVGLNTLLLLFPVIGDVFTSAVSLGILSIGLSNVRVPRIVAARMTLNALIDASVGWVPVLGDLFNLWFKADTRNVRLLQEYAGRSAVDQPSTLRHWAVVVGMGVALVLVLGLLVLAVYGLISAFAPPPPPGG